jgi:branched-chain amino acid transport system ATP-binding protein
MTAVLRIDGVTTGYTRAPVLRDVSLEVGDEIVALLGANGAGKSTLLGAVSGLVRTWKGTIELDGHRLGRASSWKRVGLGIAHVPEGRHVFKAMTVADNLDVAGLAARREGFTRDDVYEIFPRLGERHDQLAGSMSGGEQQMLAIGRALMTGPRLLLIDEMSAGLAPKTAQLLVESLRVIRERGIAMLLVEQSPQLIAGLVDRVYVLERGCVVKAGTIDEVGGREHLAEIYLGAHAASA